ncbi:MAG TPA: protein-L-isoaspartate O-methyltransferase [Acidisphaera sp.]|nr:protein-L-isoaspartate O-methyltransferase [Acidisphaera sp.]
MVSSYVTRRGLIAGGAALALAPAVPRAARAASAVNAGTGWTRDAYERAMRDSGRPVSLTDAQFEEIQTRRKKAVSLVESYLKERFGSADPAVVQAFSEVPREYYHYYYPSHQTMGGDAYDQPPKPWPIGYGSALSDYLGQVYMTQLCQPKPDHVTLEIGTGSGYQSSVLSRMVKTAYSIEIIEPLGRAVSRIFEPLGYDNVHTKVGDGYYGWPEEVDGGFDVIIVTCAAQYAPPDLFKQLKPGGRMVIPIGQPFKKGQVLYVYTKDADGKVHSKRDMGVFFIPMTGAMMKLPHPTGGAPGAQAAPPTATPAAATAPADEQK